MEVCILPRYKDDFASSQLSARIAHEYDLLKNKRRELTREYFRAIDVDLQRAREEFATLISDAHEGGMSIASICRAMGTTGRRTVYELLELAPKKSALKNQVEEFTFVGWADIEDAPGKRELRFTRWGVDGVLFVERLEGDWLMGVVGEPVDRYRFMGVSPRPGDGELIAWAEKMHEEVG